MTSSKKSAGNGNTNTKARAKKTITGTSSTGKQLEGAEDRSGRRVPIQLLVDYKSDGNYLFDFCKDLGTGGVFIQTTKPLPTGSAIDLTFTIPDSKETLITKGTVIWVQSPVADRKDLVPGMGVQFKGFSGEQRKLLEDFVQRYHGTRLITQAPGKQAV
jgi:type IV pilus assembly protein PilZ